MEGEAPDPSLKEVVTRVIGWCGRRSKGSKRVVSIGAGVWNGQGATDGRWAGRSVELSWWVARGVRMSVHRAMSGAVSVVCLCCPGICRRQCIDRWLSNWEPDNGNLEGRDGGVSRQYFTTRSALSKCPWAGGRVRRRGRKVGVEGVDTGVLIVPSLFFFWPFPFFV